MDSRGKLAVHYFYPEQEVSGVVEWDPGAEGAGFGKMGSWDDFIGLASPVQAGWR